MWEGRMNKRVCENALSVFIVVVLSCGIGCAGANYGSIIPDTAVTKSFETYQIDPDMNYYYSGPEMYPNALIGVKKRYELDSGLWKPVEAQPGAFKELIMAMQSVALEHGMFQFGFTMKDHKGQPIGVWYSILSARTFVRMGDGNKVEIVTPELIIYKEGGGANDESGK